LGKDLQMKQYEKQTPGLLKVETMRDKTTALCSEMYVVELIVVMKVLLQAENYQIKNIRIMKNCNLKPQT
jgi:hypothetical protein